MIGHFCILCSCSYPFNLPIRIYACQGNVPNPASLPPTILLWATFRLEALRPHLGSFVTGPKFSGGRLILSCIWEYSCCFNYEDPYPELNLLYILKLFDLLKCSKIICEYINSNA